MLRTNIILTTAVLALLASLAGMIFKKLKIPQVVGYITAGIIAGQSCLNLFSTETLESLSPINNISLSLIGFLIGAELKSSVLKKYGRQFTYILCFESVTPFFFTAIITGAVSFLFSGDIKESLAFALLLGSISAATAPAATTDVLKENRAKGPLTTTVLGIVALDDAAALLFYAVTASIARVLLGGAEESGALIRIIHVFTKIGLSAALGTAAGFIMIKLSQFAKNSEGRILTITLGFLFLLCGAAQSAGLDNILASMCAGVVITNFMPLSGKGVFNTVEKWTPPIYALFFVLAGARLDIRVVTPYIAVTALAYIAARTLGKTAGAIAGAKISGAPETVRRYLPFCLLSQAGVAIGLSFAAMQDFSDGTGAKIMLTITATTFIAQLAGPVFVKRGITLAGECGRDITAEDLIKECTIDEVTSDGEKIALASSVSIVNENDTVRSILDSFSRHGNLNYAVRDKTGRLSGVISIEHLKSALYMPELFDTLMAVDIMDAPAAAVNPGDNIESVLAVLDSLDTDAVPITGEDGKALGIAERKTIDHYIHSRVLSAIAAQ